MGPPVCVRSVHGPVALVARSIPYFAPTPATSVQVRLTWFVVIAVAVSPLGDARGAGVVIDAVPEGSEAPAAL